MSTKSNKPRSTGTITFRDRKQLCTYMRNFYNTHLALRRHGTLIYPHMTLVYLPDSLPHTNCRFLNGNWQGCELCDIVRLYDRAVPGTWNGAIQVTIGRDGNGRPIWAGFAGELRKLPLDAWRPLRGLTRWGDRLGWVDEDEDEGVEEREEERRALEAEFEAVWQAAEREAERRRNEVEFDAIWDAAAAEAEREREEEVALEVLRREEEVRWMREVEDRGIALGRVEWDLWVAEDRAHWDMEVEEERAGRDREVRWQRDAEDRVRRLWRIEADGEEAMRREEEDKGIWWQRRIEDGLEVDDMEVDVSDAASAVTIATDNVPAAWASTAPGDDMELDSPEDDISSAESSVAPASDAALAAPASSAPGSPVYFGRAVSPASDDVKYLPDQQIVEQELERVERARQLWEMKWDDKIFAAQNEDRLLRCYICRLFGMTEERREREATMGYVHVKTEEGGCRLQKVGEGL